MKKVLFGLLIITIGLFIITGCGNSNAVGTYKLEYSKYVGDPDTAKSTEPWTIVLESNGSGKSSRNGANYDITWSISGENIKLSEKFLGITLDYNGTLKDGKLDIYNGDKTNDLTMESVFNKQ